MRPLGSPRARSGAAASDPRPGDDVAEIMVVCTANIARSPLAMAMLEAEARRRLGVEPPVWVRSSGVHGYDGHPAVEESVAQASTRGLDLSRHRSSATDAASVRSSDLVLTMTESQRGKLARLAPDATRITFTIREFARLVASLQPLTEQLAPRDRVRRVARLAAGARAYVGRPTGREDVQDPYGGPAEAYARIADQLDGLVAVIAPALFGPLPPDPDGRATA